MCRKFNLTPDSAAESEFDSSGPIYLIYSLPKSKRHGEMPSELDLGKFCVCCLGPDCDRDLQCNIPRYLVAMDETCFGMWADS